FFQYFERYLASDLPELVADVAGGFFPVVKVRGPVAIIALSSAVARLPFVAAGKLGRQQLAQLERVLSAPSVRDKTPIFLMHHPVINPEDSLERRLQGLDDADDLARLWATLPRGLVLHGHQHRRIHRTLATPAGHLDVVGATSASLVSDDRARMAGYNLYDIADDGRITSLSAVRYDPATRTFSPCEVPRG
ncbi:MAG TPA: metallophosphoesterase, partial [Polyangiaceae bacterium]|nr:metallophosphoesterase [Polyangiaceae bacterium]